MYHVVESEENHGRSCFVIPNNWMIPERGVCYWPPGPGVESKVKSKKAVDPKTWSVYPAKILKTTDSYDEARKWLLVAEYESDLNTDAEENSTPKRPKISQPRRLRTSRTNPGNYDCSDEESEGRNYGSVLPSPPPPVNFVLVDENADIGFNRSSFSGNDDSVIELNDEVRQNVADTSATPSFAIASGSNVMFSMETADRNPTIHTFKPVTRREPAENNEILLKIAEDISVIKQTVINVERRLDHLEKEVREGRRDFSSAGQTKILRMRFSALEEFTKFDTELGPEDLNLMKAEMQECGGDSVVEFVGRVMRKVMADDLATQFSLWGHKNNQNFSATRTWIALKGAALSIRKIGPDEKAVEKAAMNWFRHAGDRLKTSKSH